MTVNLSFREEIFEQTFRDLILRDPKRGHEHEVAARQRLAELVDRRLLRVNGDAGDLS